MKEVEINNAFRGMWTCVCMRARSKWETTFYFASVRTYPLFAITLNFNTKEL